MSIKQGETVSDIYEDDKFRGKLSCDSPKLH